LMQDTAISGSATGQESPWQAVSQRLIRGNYRANGFRLQVSTTMAKSQSLHQFVRNISQLLTAHSNGIHLLYNVAFLCLYATMYNLWVSFLLQINI